MVHTILAYHFLVHRRFLKGSCFAFLPPVLERGKTSRVGENLVYVFVRWCCPFAKTELKSANFVHWMSLVKVCRDSLAIIRDRVPAVR